MPVAFSNQLQRWKISKYSILLQVFGYFEGIKLIFSTNIAESSITIPNIEIVIDTGYAKFKQYDNNTDVNIVLFPQLPFLKSDWISKENVLQRKGRAGRTQNGKCYHLYSKARYESFMDKPV